MCCGDAAPEGGLGVIWALPSLKHFHIKIICDFIVNGTQSLCDFKPKQETGRQYFGCSRLFWFKFQTPGVLLFLSPDLSPRNFGWGQSCPGIQVAVLSRAMTGESGCLIRSPLPLYTNKSLAFMGLVSRVDIPVSLCGNCGPNRS